MKKYILGTYVIERADGTLATANVKTQKQAEFFIKHIERFQIKSWSVLF